MMTARVATGLLAAALLGASPTAPGDAAGAGTPLRLAVLPCEDIETTFIKFHPLVVYLESATGLALRLTVPGAIAEFETSTANGAIDFALQDPHVYRKLSHLFDDVSLLQARALDGTTRQSAVVIVRRDSGVRDLAGLRGKTVMFGPVTSSPKWVAAKALFESRGLRLERDLKRVNGGCCEDIAFAVSIRAVDAGLVCDHFLARHAARQKDLGVDVSALTVIDRTPASPTRVFAARRGVAPATVASIMRALLDLDPANPAHASLLTSAEASGFLRTTRAEYLGALARPASARRP
jgi:phosphonate transport system substrate-binding protein